MGRFVPIVIFILLVGLVAGAKSRPRKQPTTAPAAPAPTPEKPKEFFGLTHLWAFDLRVTADGWEAMQPTRSQRNRGPQPPAQRSRWAAVFAGRPATRPAPRPASQPTTRPANGTLAAGEGQRRDPNPFGYQYAYVRGTLQFNGESFRDVAVRFKGNSSYGAGSGGLKRPYKIDFPRFVEGQKFLGLSTINFHNNAYDVTQMREALSYAVYRAAGVPASRTAYTTLTLSIGDGKPQNLGVYLVVEEVDKHFLKRHFDNSDGLLLKPEGMRGLPDFGDAWSNYEQRLRPKTKVQGIHAKRIIDFIKLVNKADDKTFRQQIGSYLAVDEFLRFLAATTLLSNLDSYLTTGHNYYLYLNPADNRIYWIPWDLNLSFGGFGMVGDTDEQINLSIMRPYSGENLLIQKVLAIDEYSQAYRQHIRRFTETFYTPEKLHAQVDAVQEVIKRAQGDAATPVTGGVPQLWRVKPDIKNFVTQRVVSVRTQLEGASQGYIPTYTRILPAAWAARTGPFAPVMMNFVRAVDANHDGKLSEPELLATLTRFFAEADKDKRGSLDESALVQHLHRTVVAALPGPALTTAPAIPGQIRPGFTVVPLARAILREADTRKTGRITQDQMLAAASRLFREADRNRSGFLEENEVLEAAIRLTAQQQR